MSVDTSNQFMVGVCGDEIVINGLARRPALSKDQALNLAAWIVALADPEQKEFRRVLEEILKT